MRSSPLTWIIDPQQILSPQGFLASAAAAGIKKVEDRLDVGLIFSSRPSIGAARFTTNVVQAAPLLVCRKNLEDSGGEIRALIVNSGNANACTGEGGIQAARQMAELAGAILGISPQQVFVSSTGVIGVPLPIDRIEKQAATLKSKLRPDGLDDVAKAIMTTDTVKKVCSAISNIEGSPVRICGMTKGAGMIHPRMATTLGFILTDVMITRALLEDALGFACEKSYNRITVDGDTSTNDTLAIIANGASGAPLIDEKGESFTHFLDGLTSVCQNLAQQIVRDGEGAGKFVEIVVQGAGTEAEATQIARSIANSPLVKTAIAGEDANWGRILCAAGYSGVRFDPERVQICIGELQVCRNGTGLAFDERLAKRILSQREICILLNMNMGEATSTMWTCDLTKEYIHINADYRT
jgi:glutamate N-acetyltransferase/amino-acid N-acetyltransferase